ncbi:MAG: hypothetical protein K1000chlam3_00729 [Chlamydiae bacterium]|nr:hypothetical protein [Chlamydiota bacterium]
MSVSFYQMNDKPDDYMCLICRGSEGNDIVAHDVSTTTEEVARHIFDKECLKNWLIKCEKGNEVCPTCRAPVDLTSLFDENEMSKFNKKQNTVWVEMNERLVKNVRRENVINTITSLFFITFVFRPSLEEYFGNGIMVKVAVVGLASILNGTLANYFGTARVKQGLPDFFFNPDLPLLNVKSAFYTPIVASVAKVFFQYLDITGTFNLSEGKNLFDADFVSHLAIGALLIKFPSCLARIGI